MKPARLPRVTQGEDRLAALFMSLAGDGPKRQRAREQRRREKRELANAPRDGRHSWRRSR